MTCQTVFAVLAVLLMWTCIGLILWLDIVMWLMVAIALGAFSLAAFVFFSGVFGKEAK